MRNISNKITSMGKSLRKFVDKYVPFYNKQTVSKENTEKPSEQSCREMYESNEVNQSFMNTSNF